MTPERKALENAIYNSWESVAKLGLEMSVQWLPNDDQAIDVSVCRIILRAEPTLDDGPAFVFDMVRGEKSYHMKRLV